MMRRKPYPVQKVTGGLTLDLDPIFLVDQQLSNVENLWFEKGLLKKDLGWANFGTGNVGGYVMAINTFQRLTGDTKTVIHTLEGAYSILANETFSKLNAANFTGNESDIWDYTTIIDANGDEVYAFTNGRDSLQKWDGNSANCSNLSGWANMTVRFLESFKTRLFAGSTVEGGTTSPYRVQWSVVGDPEDKANTGSGFVDLYETSDPLTGLKTFKNRLIVFKEHSMWEMVYTGGNSYFTPQRLFDKIGCVAPRSVASRGTELIFMGSDNVYLYDGLNANPIANAVAKDLFDVSTKIVNTEFLNRAHGRYIKEIDQYWLSIPTHGSTPERVYKYDFGTKAWTQRWELATAYGEYFTGEASVAWQDAAGDWANYSGVWVDTTLTYKTPTILRGNANGIMFEDDRTQLNTDWAWFQTKDWLFGHAHRLVEIRVQANGGPFSVFYSTDGANSWNGPANFEASNGFAEHAYQVNLTAQKLRVMIMTQAANFQLKWIEPWFIQRERSKSIVTPS